MRKYFKGLDIKKSDGWMMADCGCSGIDDINYCIDTNSLHADQVPSVCSDAKTFSQFVSGLLNLYYNNQDATKYDESQIVSIGVVEEKEIIPSPENPTLPF